MGLFFPIGHPKCIQQKWLESLREVLYSMHTMTWWKGSKEVKICCTEKGKSRKSFFCNYTFWIGPLLKKILDDSRVKIAKRSAHQLYMYAGHDSTVSNLLITLGVWDEQIPTYNMFTLIELHEGTGGNFYFKVPWLFTRYGFCNNKYTH